MKLSAIKLNPNNPRLIKDERFKKLCKSISEFPKMMELRPIVVDDSGVILGGNMRFRALQELKYKDIPDNWVKKASELTEDEKKRFIIADNVGFGDWDMDDLANNWDTQDLENWGLEIPSFEVAGKFDYNAVFKEEIEKNEQKFNITLQIEIKHFEQVFSYVKNNGKESLVKAVKEVMGCQE